MGMYLLTTDIDMWKYAVFLEELNGVDGKIHRINGGLNGKNIYTVWKIDMLILKISKF